MTAKVTFDEVVTRSRVIDRKQWRQISGLSDAVIRRLDRGRKGPPLVRLSARRVGYRLGDCIDWLSLRAETSPDRRAASDVEPHTAMPPSPG